MKTHSDHSTEHSKTASKNPGQQSSGSFFAPVIQPQLVVNSPGDKYEQEADAMATKVLRKEAPGKDEEKGMIQRLPLGPLPIHRKCTECEKEQIHRKEDHKEKEKPVMRKADGGFTTPPLFYNRLMQTKGSGQALPHTTLQKMNRAFGFDFSAVKIHTDSGAAVLSDEIGARAFTYGWDVYFANGQYSPESSSGEYLLAHELTHVTQQTGTVQRRANENAPAPVVVVTEPVAAPSQDTPTARNIQPGPATETASPPVISVAPAGPQGAVIAVEMHMPEPRLELSEREQGNISTVNRRAGRTVADQTTLPNPVESSDAARATVNEPAAETRGRSQEALLTDLKQQPPPSPEITELCNTIREVIRQKRPADEKSLVKANPEDSARVAQESLNGNVQADMNRVQQSYDRIQPGNAPTGRPQQVGQSLAAVPIAVPSDSPQAEMAVPERIPDQEISLDADASDSAARIQASGMNSETAQLVQVGPIADARNEQGNLESLAVTGRDQAMAQQQAAIAQSSAGMAELQQNALASLRASRRDTVTNNITQQGDMKKSEEETRADFSTCAECIFLEAQNAVNDILPKIPEEAMKMWNAEKTAISAKFSDRLAEVKHWIDNRHSGAWGKVLSIKDRVRGLPDWVKTSYDEAEKTFGDDICALIEKISAKVNTLIDNCETLISNAEEDVNGLFKGLGDNLPAWAIQEQARFAQRFAGMREQTSQTKRDFTRDLVSQAAQTVQEAREKIQELREAAKGLIGRIAGFVSDFINDPLRTIINGLLSLVGISKAAFWRLIDQIGQAIGEIAEHPVQFCRNLMSAIAEGFKLFFVTFPRHLLEGLFEWLFSKLRATGVEIPREFTLPSIFKFFMQLMGISWQKIRVIIGRVVGERNVAMVERVVEVVGTFMEQGIEGILEMIKGHFNPMELLDTIKQKAVDFVKEAIITAVAKKIALLFIPGGAIVEALRGIYHVLKWVFENAARIFTLLESIVGGLANIIAGNITGMASIIETALVRLIAPVIDFLADYLGFGNLPEHIASVVISFQARVESVIERVIGFLARQANSLLRTLGVGKVVDPKEAGATPVAGTLADEEVGHSIPFTVEGERHNLWVDTAGSGVEIMVRSIPMSVGAKLAEWTGRVGELPEAQQGPTRNLLTTARQQYASTKREGTKAEQEIAQARQEHTQQALAEAEQADRKVETAEQALKNILIDLFKIFGKEPIELKHIKKEFETDSSGRHSLFFEEVGGKPVLMIASEKRSFATFVNQPFDSDDPKKVQAKNTLLQFIHQLNGLEAEKEVDTEQKIEQKLNDIATHTQALYKVRFSSEPAFESTTGGFGVAATMGYLSKVPPLSTSGSPPTSSNTPEYDKLNHRRSGGGSYYVKGHLLSEKLHGPGRWENLTPLSRSANADHVNMVESRLKSRTAAGEVFFYRVQAEYGRGVNFTLLQQITNSGESNKDIKRDLVVAEQFVPKKLSIHYKEVDPLSGQPAPGPGYISIDNVIDQSSKDAYQIGNAPPVQQPNFPLKLAIATVEQLQFLPGVGPVLATNIRNAYVQHGFFVSEAALIGEVRGLSPRKMEVIRNMVEL